MLENPTNTRSKAIKKCIFMILGQLAKKYNQSFNITNSIIHMLHKFEHIPPHLAEFMEVLVNEYECTQTLSDVMRFVNCCDINGLRFINLQRDWAYESTRCSTGLQRS